MKTRSVLTIAALCAIWIPAFAQEADDEQRDKRRGPPPEAIEACTAAVEGDACAFEGRRGESLEGMCAVTREEAMACRPEGGRPPKHRRGASEDQES